MASYGYVIWQLILDEIIIVEYEIKTNCSVVVFILLLVLIQNEIQKRLNDHNETQSYFLSLRHLLFLPALDDCLRLKVFLIKRPYQKSGLQLNQFLLQPVSSQNLVL